MLIALLTHWCFSSKRKDSEPGTKSLLSNAEMMAHHPTDPVEMRRINFQTPGRQRAPPRAPEETLFVLNDKIYFWLLIIWKWNIHAGSFIPGRNPQTRLRKFSSSSQPTHTWQLLVVSEIKMASTQVVQSLLSHGWVITVWQNLIISARPQSTCQAAESSIRTNRNDRNLPYQSWMFRAQSGFSEVMLWVNSDHL